MTPPRINWWWALACVVPFGVPVALVITAVRRARAYRRRRSPVVIDLVAAREAHARAAGEDWWNR